MLSRSAEMLVVLRRANTRSARSAMIGRSVVSISTLPEPPTLYSSLNTAAVGIR